MTKPWIAPLPVICIGNVTVGGAGKTPTAILIAKILKAKGHNPCFISRGYGAKLKQPTFVDLKIHDYTQVGDEPILLSKVAPCCVYHDRKEAIKLAHQKGFDIVIMDDGLQNNSVHKNTSILVVDGQYRFGNEYIFPAGPLREKVHCGIEKIDFIIINNGNAKQAKELEEKFKKPVILSEITADTLPKGTNKDFIAFAGIAIPEKFFKTLEKQGLNVIETKSYPDHYAYQEKEICKLLALAKEKTGQLITTEKDIIKIPIQYQKEIMHLPIRLTIKNSDSLYKLIKAKI